MARIKRILLYAVSGLDKNKLNELYSAPTYARVLAVKDDKKDALKILGENLITSYSDFLSAPESVKAAIELENKDVLLEFQDNYPGVLNGDNLADILKAAREKKQNC